MWAGIVNFILMLVKAFAVVIAYKKGEESAQNEQTKETLKEIVKQKETSEKVDRMSDSEVFDYLKTKPARKRDRTRE